MRSLLNAGVASLLRYEADGTATVLAASGDPGTEVSLLSHLTLEGRSAAGAVFSSGRMARIDEPEGPPGSVAAAFAAWACARRRARRSSSRAASGV
jgi:hypothetical protein